MASQLRTFGKGVIYCMSALCEAIWGWRAHALLLKSIIVANTEWKRTKSRHIWNCSPCYPAIESILPDREQKRKAVVWGKEISISTHHGLGSQVRDYFPCVPDPADIPGLDQTQTSCASGITFLVCSWYWPKTLVHRRSSSLVTRWYPLISKEKSYSFSTYAGNRELSLMHSGEWKPVNRNGSTDFGMQL